MHKQHEKSVKLRL